MDRLLGARKIGRQRHAARIARCHLVQRRAAHRRELVQESLALRM
jgi:hypothetical protein